MCFHAALRYPPYFLALLVKRCTEHGGFSVAGHITVRDPVDPTTFWVNPFGVAWPLLRASDLIRVDESGTIVDGGAVRLLNVAGESKQVVYTCPGG
jgi:hypothetical protein